MVRKASCFVVFDTDTGHDIRLYLYHGYYGYIDGATANGASFGAHAEWHVSKKNTAYTFFDDIRSKQIINNVPVVDNYVTFNSVIGYRPNELPLCPPRIIIDEEDEYIPFEDANTLAVCCENWGDYKETVITDNGDDTVDITVTVKSMLNTSVNRSKVISTQTAVDNTGGTYTAGTTKEPVGISKRQVKVVTTIPDQIKMSFPAAPFNEL